MSEITTQVRYASDYPIEDGVAHAYFADALVDGVLSYSNELISYHPAVGCLIDHESRKGEVEIPAELLLRFRRYVWAANKLNQE
jgi:hypothetical protein